MDDEEQIRRIDIRVEQIGDEWCAFHVSGQELARSKDKPLLHEYLSEVFPSNKKAK